MSLLPITKAQAIGAQIDAINIESISFIRSQMTRAYNLANTPNQQQAVMDIFGPNASAAIGVYATLRSALHLLGQADGLPEADFTIFQPQADGTILYVAPAIPVVDTVASQEFPAL